MSDSTLNIRNAVPDDVPVLAKVAWQSFDEAFSGHPANHPDDMKAYMDVAFAEGTIRSELQDPANIYLVAEIGGEIVGYAKLRRDSREDCIAAARPIELCRLYCLDRFIGRGIGRQLMEKCLSIARAEDFEVMWLGVWTFNIRAQEFYKKTGFEKCGEHVFLLGADPQTDWVMQLRLS